MNQDTMVLKYIAEKGSIDNKKAIDSLGVYRLSSCIHRLRKLYDIETNMHTTINRYGSKCYYAKYSFKGEAC